MKRFDLLLDQKADLYQCSQGGSFFRKPFYFAAFVAGRIDFNDDMVMDYMSSLKLNFLTKEVDTGCTNEMGILSNYRVIWVLEAIKPGEEGIGAD